MIHFINNMSVTDDQKKDKLLKVRPWIEQLRNRFHEIPPEDNHAVDDIRVSPRGSLA